MPAGEIKSFVGIVSGVFSFQFFFFPLMLGVHLHYRLSSRESAVKVL